MDRNIVYPGSIPLDTDILYPNRNAMVGIAALTAATLGSIVVATGWPARRRRRPRWRWWSGRAASRSSRRLMRRPMGLWPPM